MTQTAAGFTVAADSAKAGLDLGRQIDEALAGQRPDARGGVDLVGCNTYGQIARAAGQLSGFHHCTAVVFAFPE